MTVLELPINNQNDALNVMVQFLMIAHKRGTFQLDESAKIWQAIQMFEVPPPPQSKSVPEEQADPKQSQKKNEDCPCESCTC